MDLSSDDDCTMLRLGCVDARDKERRCLFVRQISYITVEMRMISQRWGVGKLRLYTINMEDVWRGISGRF